MSLALGFFHVKFRLLITRWVSQPSALLFTELPALVTYIMTLK